MFIRISLATILAISVSVQALAQTNAKDKLKERFKKVPVNEVAQDPTNQLTPLPELPLLPGNTWREWIVPGHFTQTNSPSQRTSGKVTITNLRKSEVDAKVECYGQGGGRTFSKTLSIRKHANGTVNVLTEQDQFKSFGWCRVSADHPVMVYYQVLVRELGMHANENTGVKYDQNYSETVLAIPYPIE